MQVRDAHPNPLVSYAISGIVIAIVFALRWRGMKRVRPLKLERLWVFPALYAVAVVAMFASRPPQGIAWLFCAGALALGAALGWQRGRLMRITVDPETHALNQSGSPAALLFVLLLVAVRSGARAAFSGDTVLHLNALAVTDMLMAFALGLFSLQRIEMALRAQRMLAEARRG